MLVARRALRTLIVVPLVVLLAVALGACGGDGGGDEDPKQVIEDTFSAPIESGKINLTIDASAEGDQSGNFEATLTGPFDDKGESFDLDVKASGSGGGQDLDFEGGATSAGGKLYVNYNDQDYEVGKNRTGGADPSQARKLFSSANIDPIGWLTDLKNEGHEDVEGTETVHVSGSANVEGLADDLQTLVQKASKQIPGADAPTGQVADQFKQSVKEATLDVYSSTEDNTLRKLEAVVAVDPPESANAQFDRLDLNFTVTFSGIGDPQTIQAPENAKSLNELLSGFGGLGGQGAGGNGASSEQSQRYLDCLRKAQGSSEIQECSKLLQ